MDGQIAVFAVAEQGSFEAAGKYLGIGKSAVRKCVNSVESERNGADGRARIRSSSEPLNLTRTLLTPIFGTLGAT